MSRITLMRIPGIRQTAVLIAVLIGGTALFGHHAAAQSYGTSDSGITVDEPDKTFAPGQQFTVTGTGFKPFSDVDVYAHSTPVKLGTLTADSLGTVSGSFTIPAGLAAGDHTLTMQGVDATGSPRTLSLPVQVTADGAVPDALSFTGTTVAPLVVGGVGLVVVGAMMVRFNRRRSGAGATA
jgi:hypothetical protein